MDVSACGTRAPPHARAHHALIGAPRQVLLRPPAARTLVTCAARPFWVARRDGGASSFVRVHARAHCDDNLRADAPTVSVTFVGKDGVERHVRGRVGQNVLHLAHESGVDLEGACECSLACSTCHVILEPRVYDSLEAPKDEEEDLLDLAFGLTATSRLGCQVHLTPACDGMRVRLPAATRNFYVDGHKPKPH